MKFNFHIIAEDAKSDAEEIANKLRTVLTDAGKVVNKVIFTDDNGVKELNPIVQTAADVVEAVVPEAAPVIKDAEAVVTTAANDASKVESDVKTDAASVQSDPANAGSDAKSLVQEIEADVENLIHKL